jgi:hypothetical protein
VTDPAGWKRKKGRPAAAPFSNPLCSELYSMPLLRHVEVDLHFRHTRSPAQALGNDSRQIRHFLTFCSALRRASRSASHVSAQPSAHVSWQSVYAPV